MFCATKICGRLVRKSSTRGIARRLERLRLETLVTGAIASSVGRGINDPVTVTSSLYALRICTCRVTTRPALTAMLVCSWVPKPCIVNLTA